MSLTCVVLGIQEEIRQQYFSAIIEHFPFVPKYGSVAMVQHIEKSKHQIFQPEVVISLPGEIVHPSENC